MENARSNGWPPARDSQGVFQSRPGLQERILLLRRTHQLQSDR